MSRLLILYRSKAMPCSCKNHNPNHNCNEYKERLYLMDGELAYDCGLPVGTVVLEAIWEPCDKSCIWPDACKGHIEAHCMDPEGNEFYRYLTMGNAQALIWKTRMKIYRIEREEGGCPQCGSMVVREGRCFTCPSCGLSACG